MGLDMYLEARRHVAPCDPQTEPMRRALGTAIGYVPPKDKPGNDTSLLEVCGVTVRVGYWRKFASLHQWFVGNVQGGARRRPPRLRFGRNLDGVGGTTRTGRR